jgi:hypothetical protein
MAKKEAPTFYFVDTREGAKSEKPFGIQNADVAKAWTKDFNNGEGPFKPVDNGDVEFVLNRRDLKEANKEEITENEVGPTLYDEMTNAERMEELDARGIDYKSSATKKELIALLVADDNK